MKLFNCGVCGNTLYFENYACLKCGHAVGFDPKHLTMVALDKTGGSDVYVETNGQVRYRYCENVRHNACNWLIHDADNCRLCIACELNQTIPDLKIQENVTHWQKIEAAKHRLIYSILKLNLPLTCRTSDPNGLAFEFKAEVQGEKVMTGHNEGLITLNILEANEVERTRHKLNLGEKYRTLLGHMRHEVGHYYWNVMVRDTGRTEECAQIFGDHNKDYGLALENYYKSTPPEDWMNNYISIYATSHPWEDWAESFSHYLHMMDTLETAYAFGLTVNPEEVEGDNFKASMRKDPYDIATFEQIVTIWLPITFALNSLNRSMGHQDFYPFHISDVVIGKLTYIHNLCKEYYNKKDMVQVACES